MLVESIKNAIASFPQGAGKEDEDPLAKVSRIANIVQDLMHQVEDMKAQQIPRTPLEVLVERKRVVSEAAEKIK